MKTYVSEKAFLWKQRFGFAAIDFGRVLVQSFADIYLSLFLTTVALMPVGSVSLMFLLCKFIDAITDVIVGILVDKTKTKLGRSRPWLYGGCIIFAIGVFAMFQVPDLAVGGKIAYMYFSYIIYTLGLTMCNIPEGSMMALISKDSSERTIYGSIRGIAYTVGNTILGSAIIPLVAILGKDNNIIGYSRTSLLFALLMVLFIVIGNSIVREVNEPIKKKSDVGGTKNLLYTIKHIFTCKNFNCIMLFCFGNLIYTVAVASTMSYYCLYVLDARTDLMGFGLTAQNIVGLLAAFIAPLLNKKIGKRSITILGAVIGAVGIALRYLAPTMPLMLIVGMAIFGFGQGFLNCMVLTTQPDVVDELAVKVGRHNPGIIMALFSLGCQVGAGVGNAVTTFILGLGGFDGAVDQQIGTAITSINIVFGGVALVAFAIIIISMLAYDLDKKFPQINTKLEKLRAASEG